MSSFLIKKNEEEVNVIKLNLEENGYDFRPRITNSDAKINKITLFNYSMIDVILSKKIDNEFKKIAAIVYDILANDDDNTTSDATIALDEVARLRGIILNKYQKFLEKEKEKKYLKKLRILENELRAKIVCVNSLNNYANENIELDEKRGRGRWIIY